MEHRPTPRRDSPEPEIIPPGHPGAPMRDSPSQVWISFNRQGNGYTYTARPGVPAIMVALLFGILMFAIFVVVFATLFVWIVVAGAIMTLALLTAVLLRRFRKTR